MLPTEVPVWLVRAGTVLGLACSCTSLDDRTVTLQNGEQCNEQRQCESLHCELAAENRDEQDIRICCSISCAAGSACAPSGTSCVVCAQSECNSVCEDDECTMNGQPADGTEQGATASGVIGSSDRPVSSARPVSPVQPAPTTTPDAGTASVNAASAASTTPSTNVDGGTVALSTGDVDGTNTGHAVASSEHASTTVETADVAPSTSVATSAETIPPEQIPECDEPLLINGDFENEMQAWTEEGSYVGLSQRVHPMVVADDDDSVSAYDAVAHSGSYFAYVGGVPDDQDRGHHSAIVQHIVVPTDAVALWLRGYVWVTTDDMINDEYDFGFIQLERTAEDENYRQFQFWTNQDATEGWVEFEAVLEELADLPGKEIRFLVGSITDEMGTTRFWFDALQLEGICP